MCLCLCTPAAAAEAMAATTTNIVMSFAHGFVSWAGKLPGIPL